MGERQTAAVPNAELSKGRKGRWPMHLPHINNAQTIPKQNALTVTSQKQKLERSSQADDTAGADLAQREHSRDSGQAPPRYSSYHPISTLTAADNVDQLAS